MQYPVPTYKGPQPPYSIRKNWSTGVDTLNFGLWKGMGTLRLFFFQRYAGIEIDMTFAQLNVEQVRKTLSCFLCQFIHTFCSARSRKDFLHLPNSQCHKRLFCWKHVGWCQSPENWLIQLGHQGGSWILKQVPRAFLKGRSQMLIITGFQHNLALKLKLCIK